MSHVGPLPPLQEKKEPPWNHFVGDSFLVLGSTLLLAEIISFFRLYQRIPDSFLVYLLLILVFASTRGLYAALLASFAAFFFYDFLYVPPTYSLLVSKFEDMLALVVFLVTAIVTAHLASEPRQRAEQADRRERETRILYDLVRVTNREENLLHQLQVFMQAVVEVFSPWGILDCTMLLPDALGKLVPRTTMSDLRDAVTLSPAEEEMAYQGMKQAQTMDLRNGVQRARIGNNAASMLMQKAGVTIRLVPLKTAHKAIGVLRLLLPTSSGVRDWS
jgi:two-component system, OmpR family, sensor histidine kinase KdpD